MTKPEQLVKVHRSIENVNEAIASDRRKFVQGLGIAVLTVQCLPLIAHAA